MPRSIKSSEVLDQKLDQEAVLFDFGDTLVRRRENPVAATAKALGLQVDGGVCAALWADIEHVMRSRQEIAKGRDLSAGAHRELLTAI
jgi:hypothetical protein